MAAVFHPDELYGGHENVLGDKTERIKSCLWRRYLEVTICPFCIQGVGEEFYLVIDMYETN
jgi:hypothetical protein